MPEGDGVVFNDLKEQVLLGTHDLDSDTLQMTLHTAYTPDIDAHQVWADVSGTEYGTGDGYTAGGKALTTVAVSQDDANDRAEVDCDDILWTSLGPLSPATPSDCIMWNNTPSSPADPLMIYWELGTTATNGGNYTLQIGANGFLWLT